MTKKSEDEIRKEKTELFKKVFLGQESPASKADEFARLVAGDYKKDRKPPAEPKRNRRSTPGSYEEMRDFMRDPFDAKGWAASREIKKPDRPDMIEMVIAEPSEEELQKFWASQPQDDE